MPRYQYNDFDDLCAVCHKTGGLHYTMRDEGDPDPLKMVKSYCDSPYLDERQRNNYRSFVFLDRELLMDRGL